MSPPRNEPVRDGRVRAHVFAALGDATRLALVAKLCGGLPQSITELTENSRLSRQAVTKHLRVLERAGIVRSARRGRENRFTYDPVAVEEARNYLDAVAAQWSQALARLKRFVEQ